MPISERATMLARRRNAGQRDEAAASLGASLSYVRRNAEPDRCSDTMSGTNGGQRASKFIAEHTTAPLSVAGAEVELGVEVR